MYGGGGCMDALRSSKEAFVINIGNTAQYMAVSVLYFIAAIVIVCLLAIYMIMSSIFHFVKGSDKYARQSHTHDYWR